MSKLKVPYKMNQEFLKNLRKDVKKFRKLMTEASAITANMYAFVNTYGTLETNESQLMRAMAQDLRTRIDYRACIELQLLLDLMEGIAKADVEILHK